MPLDLRLVEIMLLLAIGPALGVIQEPSRCHGCDLTRSEKVRHLATFEKRNVFAARTI